MRTLFGNVDHVLAVLVGAVARAAEKVVQVVRHQRFARLVGVARFALGVPVEHLFEHGVAGDGGGVADVVHVGDGVFGAG